MSDSADKELQIADQSAGLVSKGLAAVSSAAPGYTLTASIGLSGLEDGLRWRGPGFRLARGTDISVELSPIED